MNITYGIEFERKVIAALGIDIDKVPISRITIDKAPGREPVITLGIFMTTEVEAKVIDAVGLMRWIPDPEAHR